MPKSCEVVEMQNSADTVGYPCSRTANTQCSDCGTELCESHTETCGGCHCDLLPILLDVPSAALEASLSGSRQTSGAEKSL